MKLRRVGREKGHLTPADGLLVYSAQLSTKRGKFGLRFLSTSAVTYTHYTQRPT